MDLSWKKICRPTTWEHLTDDERDEIKLHMSMRSYSLDEVKTLLEEQRKYIASRFEGDATLISNKICETRVLNSNEYELNLRLGIRIKELNEK